MIQSIILISFELSINYIKFSQNARTIFNVFMSVLGDICYEDKVRGFTLDKAIVYVNLLKI